MMLPQRFLRTFKVGVLVLLAPAAAFAQTVEPDGSKQLSFRRWPMFGQNFQHSGRSVFAGAQTGNVRWYIPSTRLSTNPVVADDGTIFLGERFQCDQGCTGGNLYAIDPWGIEKWHVWLGGRVGNPAIASDGTIYAPVDEGFVEGLLALHPDSTGKWAFHFTVNGSGFSPLTLGPDGTVYFSRLECPVAVCDVSGVYAVNPDGTLRFRFQAQGNVGGVALGLDGTVYLGTRNVATPALYALNSAGGEKWRLPTGAPTTAPVVSFGTIYVGAGSMLLAVKPDGTLKWAHPTGGPVNAVSAGWDGTIYASVSDVFGLYAVNPNGTRKWVYADAMNPGLGMGEVFQAASISGTGIAYVQSAQYNPPSLRGLYAIDPNGSLKWRRSLTDSPEDTFAVAIDANRIIYAIGLGLWAIGP